MAALTSDHTLGGSREQSFFCHGAGGQRPKVSFTRLRSRCWPAASLQMLWGGVCWVRRKPHPQSCVPLPSSHEVLGSCQRLTSQNGIFFMGDRTGTAVERQ